MSDDKTPNRPTSDEGFKDPAFSDDYFRLGKEPDGKREAKLKALHTHLAECQKHFLGYQVSQELKSEQSVLAPFLGIHTNNIGDPFTDSGLRTHTKWLERSVLNYYAELWGAKPYRKEKSRTSEEEDLETAWGYVLSMGSSEGNVYGLLNARDYLAGRMLMVEPLGPLAVGRGGSGGRLYLAEPLPSQPGSQNQSKQDNEYKPIAFYSRDTHYSVAKAAHILGIPSREVESTNEGSIHIQKLVEMVEEVVNQGHPVLVILNLGSTFKGAYDDVEEAALRLGPIFEKGELVDRKVQYLDKDNHPQEDRRNGYWIHVDGALGASYVPFLRRAQKDGLVVGPRVPQFDFSIGQAKPKEGLPYVAQVSSIVTSGHKFPGSPWPSGVFMTKRKFQLEPPRAAEYVGSPDTTFGGSRNGFSAVVLWNFLAKRSDKGQMDMVVASESLAEKAMEELAKVAIKTKKDFLLKRTPWALSIRFREPNRTIVQRYSLALATDGDERVCHLFIMPHVTITLIKELVDELLAAIENGDAFPEDVEPKSSAFRPADLEAIHVNAYMAMDRGFA